MNGKGKSNQCEILVNDSTQNMYKKNTTPFLESHNQRLLHRIHVVNKILKKYKKERRFLMARLDHHGDNYREAPEALPYETQEGNQTVLSTIEQLATKTSKSATSTEPTHGKKKSKADNKDPNAPKKPVNAYVMFFQHKRQSVQESYFKEHNQDIGNHELTKIIGQQWNNLSPNEKKVFYDLYEKDKERYQQEMTKYEESKEELKKQSQE